MSQYGVGLNAEINIIVNQLKFHIAREKGQVTVRNLANVFNRFDRDGSQRLNSEEFEKALGVFGFFLKRHQYQTVFNCFDQEKTGLINYTDFIRILREPLSERRLKVVLKVYDILDSSNNGFITKEDLLNTYDVSNNQDFIKGRRSVEDIKSEFVTQFALNEQGQISKQEFIAFYEDVSVAVPSENYFVEILFSSYGVTEDKESIISDSEVKNIVKIIRYKLIQATNGIHDEFLLKKLFTEFDANNSGYLCLDELYAMTIKLEIPIHKKYLSALFRKFDRNQSGFIEFDEFLYFITYDPYP